MDHSEVRAIIKKKDIKVMSVDRVAGGLRYNIVEVTGKGNKRKFRKPRTLRVNADELTA